MAPKRTPQERFDDMLLQGTAQALEELKKLLRVGKQDKRFAHFDPIAKNAREAAAYAALRLKAAEQILALRFGTKSRAALTPEAVDTEERKIRKLQAMAPAKRRECIGEAVARGEMSVEEGDVLLKMLRESDEADGEDTEALAEELGG